MPRPPDPRAAQARREHLGESAEHNHVDLVRVGRLVERQLEKRGNALPAKPQGVIRAVLDDRDPVPTGDLKKVPSPVQWQGAAGRVLERRDGVEQRPRAQRLELLVERLGHDPVVIRRYLKPVQGNVGQLAVIPAVPDTDTASTRLVARRHDVIPSPG